MCYHLHHPRRAKYGYYIIEKNEHYLTIDIRYTLWIHLSIVRTFGTDGCVN